MEVLLLFRVLSAVNNADARRQMQSRNDFLHLRHPTAKAAALQARRDGNIALQVLTSDFGLSGSLADGSQRSQGCGMSGTADQQRVTHSFQRGTVCGRKAYANRVRAIIRDHRSWSRLALEDRRSIERDFFGREPGSRRYSRIYLKRYRRSAHGVVDSIQQIDHAWDLPNRIGHFRSPLFQLLGILRKQLDLDGLRCRCQVADHILQHLYEIDIEGRFLFLDLSPNVRHDFFDIAVTICLQLYQNVTGIRLCYRSEPELQSCAARSALHLRHFVQHLFHVSDHAVGFCKRTAGGHDVVDCETAFVHLGQQVGIAEFEGDKRNQDESDAENDQLHRAFERPPQPASVKIDHLQEETAEMFLLRLQQSRCLIRFIRSLVLWDEVRIGLVGTSVSLPSDEVLAQIWRPGEC